MFKKAFYILKNNLIFIQPLLLCLLLFMTAGAFASNRNLYLIPRIILLISMVLLLIAFTAGWFYINKYGILNYNEQDSKEEITIKAVQNFKKFFEGIGAGFARTSGMYFILLITYVLAWFCVYKFCMLCFGEPEVIYEFPKLAQTASQEEIINFINNIPNHDKLIFSMWVFVINIAFSVVNFFAVLYFSAGAFEEVNIIKTLWRSVIFFFKNILGVISIILVMFALYMLLNLLSLLSGANAFSMVILLILFTVFLNYYAILVMCFYYDKTKNSCNNGTELVG